MPGRSVGGKAVTAAAILCVAAACSGTAAAEGRSQVMVVSKPSGGTVYIDGEERGKTPLTLTGLDMGNHEIRIVLDGYDTWTKRIRFRPGGNTIDAKLEGKTAPPVSEEPRAGKAGRDGPAPPKAGLADPGPVAKAEEKKDEVPKTRKVPCPCCEAKGVIDEIGCSVCDADGCFRAASCRACSGTGRRKYDCPACGGIGKEFADAKVFECTACKNKGHPLCPACKGSGEIDRLNPEAAGYETTACLSCGGDGWEKHLKCKKCASTGKLRDRYTVGEWTYTTELVCPLCGGDGIGPERCGKCDGTGFRRQGRDVFPCMVCYGTGHLFLPCRTCGGHGWHRAR